MGIFGSKEKKSEPDSIPELPKLPRLPEISIDMPEERMIHQLPSFPTNSFGRKFSQNSIKDAVSGERGDVGFDADLDERGMMRESPRRPMTEEVEEELEEEISGFPIRERHSFRQEAEPVFVRLDMFEEGLKIFEQIKDQISDIERILAETKKIKEKEEAELRNWEAELKKMKTEIEKIDADIFSKV